MNKILVATICCFMFVGLATAGLTTPLDKKQPQVPEGCLTGLGHPVQFNGVGDFKIKVKIPGHEDPLHMGRLAVYDGELKKAKKVKIIPMPLMNRTAYKFMKGGEVHLKGNVDAKLYHLGYQYEVKAKGFTYSLIGQPEQCQNLKLKHHQKFN